MMGKSYRTTAVILALLTSACSAAPTLISAAKPAGDLSGVRAAAAGETAGLLRELGVTGDAVDRRWLAAEDVAEMDTDHDGRVESQEVAKEFAETLEGALNAGTAAQPAALQSAVTLPQFFINPNPQPNETQLLIDEAQIFPELFSMLRSAEKRIQMDFFLLGGELGLSIARVLAQKATEGVEVNLMMDPKLGLAGPTTEGILRVVEFLKLKQVPYRFYPLALYGQMPNGFQNKVQIDHNKILVVDGKKALIGSMNLDDNARMNHDLMVRVEGPTASEIGAMLATEWPFGTDPTKKTTVPAAPVGPTMHVQAQGLMRLTQTAPQERTTRELLLREINRAQRSVHVAMYEFGDPELAAALATAYKRGVDVRVMMDDKGTLDKYGFGAAPAGLPNLMPARELLKAGAQVRWYAGQRVNQELHMKMVVIDGQKMVAGSTNWTTNALSRWRETSFVIEGPTAVDAETMFLKDWNENSRRVDRLTLKQRIVARVVDWMNKHDRAFW